MSGGGGVVLVVTHWFDPTADHVVEELNRRRVPVLRFDAADFPRQLVARGRLGDRGWRGTLHLDGRAVAFERISGAYFRRPTVFGFGVMDEAERDWALAEARAGLGGLLMACDRWLNHPHYSGYAAYKPVQLAEAAAAEALRLRFGAFDFLASPSRGWVFLERNPNGQWAWIEQATGQPIASAIADALTAQDRT